jgi:voltage-gated potassium channel
MDKEELHHLRPGDKALRIHKRRRRRRLRIVPDIPGFVRFLRGMAAETPLVKIMIALLVLWLLAAWGIYEAEKGAEPQIDSYGHALWWCFAAMQTQGANSPGPVTPIGILIGSIWSIVSTIGLFGVIIGTLYAYFMTPKRRPRRAIVNTLQYNLEKLEDLSGEELELVKETLGRVVDSRLEELKKDVSDG